MKGEPNIKCHFYYRTTEIALITVPDFKSKSRRRFGSRDVQFPQPWYTFGWAGPASNFEYLLKHGLDIYVLIVYREAQYYSRRPSVSLNFGSTFASMRSYPQYKKIYPKKHTGVLPHS